MRYVERQFVPFDHRAGTVSPSAGDFRITQAANLLLGLLLGNLLALRG
jgi:hypothetical protein